MKKSWEDVFKECGAVLNGHFVLASLKHSDTYLEKVILYKDPVIFEEMCQAIAQEVSSKLNNIEVVLGPVPIGSAIAQRVAFHLVKTYGRMVTPLFTEKGERGEHFFRKCLIKDMAGKNVLVVDDVMTSGDTIMQIVKAVVTTSLRGQMMGAAVICDRGEVALNNLYQMFPVMPLSRLKPRLWAENDCPLCKARIPIDVGSDHGLKFIESHPDYPYIK